MEFSIDGGSRGNPGPAGYGVHIIDGAGQLVDELYASIGVATNNVAEYSGLLAALRYAVDRQYENITIRSDSLLLVCQMKGEYRVKNAGLKTLHAEARQLASRLGRVRFVHVKREQNAEADALANRAMDEAEKRDAGTRPQKGGSRSSEGGTWPPTGRLF
jgi:probable phosphoglycerate mutase